MKNVSVVIFAVLLLILSIAPAARSATLENVPIFSAQRASLAAVADYAFYSGASAPNFPVRKEWQGGFSGAYKMTPTLAAHAIVRYGADSKQFETKLGLVLRIWSGTGQ